MLPTIATGNVASAIGGGYTVDNSCRFNDGDSPVLSRTLGTATNRKICTFSHWVKMSDTLNNIGWFGTYNSGNNFRWGMMASASDGAIDAYEHDGSAYVWRRKTNRRFRDTAAFYHLMLVLDTTQSTAGDRVKIYVNGVQETSFSSSDDPGLNIDLPYANSAVTHYVGKHNTEYFDGYMAEVVFIDGQALTPTSFGEFDEDSPTIWKPIDVSGLTFGTNGFYLDFEASDNLGNDANGGTDWTEANLDATDQATDTPTNSFCTMNPLSGLTTSSQSFSEGNLVVTNSAGGMRQYNSSFAAASGKWYAEVKVTSVGGDAPGVGIIDPSVFDYDSHIAASNSGYCYLYGGNKQYNGSGASFGDSWTTGDIIGIAIDLTNSKLYFSKNGTWQNSGDPTSGATGTGSAYDIVSDVFYTFGGSSNDTGTDPVYSWNFGNPSFAISSGNADGDGYGNFEYAVPSGYYALCTKNLAEYG